MEAPAEGTAKKTSLEDLTKEELVTKCKNFLSIAQKAKQSKDVLIEENRKLKEQLNDPKGDPNTELIIKTLTQQKLELLTALEELRSQKGFLDNKYREAEKELCDLDTTNQGYKRQVARLTEENETLITQLDELERQIEELKKIGLEQQEQLLALEKNNVAKEFRGTKSGGSDESNTLKSEISQLKEKLDQKDKNIHQLGEELIAKNDFIQSLGIELEMAKNEHLKYQSDINLLQNNFKKLEDEFLNVTKELNERNAKFSEELMSKNVLIENLEIELNILQKSHLCCISEKSILEDDVKKWKESFLTAEGKLDEHKAHMHKNETRFSEELNSRNDLIKDLGIKLEIIQKEHLSCAPARKSFENILQKIKQDFLDTEKQMQENSTKFTEELISKNDFIVRLETELKTLRKEHSNCNSEKESLEGNFQKFKENFLKVEEKLYESKTHMHENNRKLSEELTSTNDLLKNLEDQLKTLEKEHSNCTFEKNILENEKEDLKATLLKVQEELNKTKTTFHQDTSTLSEELASKNNIIENLETKLGKVHSERDALKFDFKKLNEEFLNVKTKLSEELNTLQEEHLTCTSEKESLEKNVEKLTEDHLKVEKALYDHKTMLLDNSKEIEKNNNLIDDLTTELHKYRALSQKLQQDVQNSNNKLADNQIVSSGVASDLENANERLKEKLRIYHGKIVKFAGDVKKLKESKNELILSFKTYTNQVNEWKALLIIVAKKIENNSKENDKIKLENQQLHKKITDLNLLDENNKSLKEEINILKQKLSPSESDSEKVDELTQKYALKQSQLLDLESKLAVAESTPHEIHRSGDELAVEMNHIKSIFQAPRDDLFELVKENEQMCNQITELRQREHKFMMKIDMLKGHVSELNKDNLNNEKLQCRVQDLLNEVSDLNKTIEEVKSKEEKYQCRIKHYETEVEKLGDYRSAVEELSMKIQESEVNSTDLRNLNKDLKDKIEEQEAALSKYAEGIDHLEKANSDLNKQMTENEANRDELKCVNRGLLKNIDEYKRMIERYLTDIDKLEGLNKESNHKLQLCEIRSSELQTDNDDILNRIKSYECLVEKYSSDIRKLEHVTNGSTEIEISEIESSTTELTGLRTANEDLVKKLQMYEEKLEQYNKDIHGLDQLNQELSKKIEAYQITSEEFNELKALNKDLNQKIIEYNNHIKTLQDKNEDLSKQLDKSRSEEIQLAEQTSEEIIKQVNKNKELDKRIETLREEIHEIKNKKREGRFTQTEDNRQGDSEEVDIDFEDKLSVLKRENTELLSEMNVMNQALKERGEVISKQQSYCEEILKKMQLFEAQNAANMESLMRKEETIEMLQRELSMLKNESCGALDNEEKISKKNSEISRLRCEVVELKEKISSQLESSEYNYPDSETMSTLSATSKAEEMSRMKDIEGSWEERYGKLRNLAIKLKAKIRQLTEEVSKEQSEKNELQQKLGKIKQSYQQQIDLLQDQLEATSKQSKSYLKELETVTKEVSNDKKKLAQNEDMISKFKMQVDNLEKEKQNTEDWKKQIGSKVQTLKRELEANNMLKKEFENKICKLNLDLEAKDKALKQEIEKHNETRASLLEFTSECKKQSVLNLEIQDYERSVKDLSQKIEKKQEIINKLKAQIDNQKLNLDSLQEQSRAADENVTMYEEQLTIANRDNELHKRKIVELQAALSEKESRIQDLSYSVENIRLDNEDLSTQLSKTIVEHEKNNTTLKQECELYKHRYLGLEDSLRVIRQQLHSKEHELEEIQSNYENYKVRAQSVLRQNQSRDVRTEERLKEESASLRAQVDILSAELHQCKLCTDNLSHENTDLQMRNQEIAHRLEGTEAELHDSRKELDRLSLKHQQMIIEHTETVRGLKLHGDTLAQCYRQQISDQEDRHLREITDLQSRIERGSTPPDLSALVVPSMPREEGEGSESVDSAANGRARPVPLETLLSNETEETCAVRQQLVENETKVSHLTALLADTEQDLAKHVQMNKVLKEEIRRQQRSVERERHAENLEYLKNVVYKFLTLGYGDERERLVPVLNTILKLSPEETQKLTLVAKGEKTWSNYLPLWKPQ